MKINDLKQSPYKFKIFLMASISGLILLLIVNFYILPTYFGTDSSILKTFTDVFNNLTALLISSVMGILFLYLLTPKVISKSEIVIIEPRDLRQNLQEILNSTNHYSYVGHTGRWTRSVTLQKLYEDAKNNKITKIVDLTILNPNEMSVLKYFNGIGHGIREKGNKITSAKDLKKELISTVLICYLYSQKPFMKINLYLSSKVSLFRFDLSEKAIIITKPNPLDPALKVYSGTFFYDSYNEEIKLNQEQSIKINFDYEITDTTITIEIFKKLMQRLEISLEELNDNDILDIIKSVEKPQKPF
ncbi:hypothetical protein KKG72_05310 [bacterium]|nr:hypothetical protein [bacterium]MBU1995384.1 hypothetical protein [bacterium]